MSVPLYFQTRHSGCTEAEIEDFWKKHLQHLQADLMASMDQGRPASDWSRNVVLYHILKALYPALNDGLVLGNAVGSSEPSSSVNEKIKHLEYTQYDLQQQLQHCQAQLQLVREENALFKTQLDDYLKSQSESPAHPEQVSPTPASSPVHPPQVSPVLSVSTDTILKF